MTYCCCCCCAAGWRRVPNPKLLKEDKAGPVQFRLAGKQTCMTMIDWLSDWCTDLADLEPCMSPTESQPKPTNQSQLPEVSRTGLSSAGALAWPLVSNRAFLRKAAAKITIPSSNKRDTTEDMTPFSALSRSLDLSLSPFQSCFTTSFHAVYAPESRLIDSIPLIEDQLFQTRYVTSGK